LQQTRGDGFTALGGTSINQLPRADSRGYARPGRVCRQSWQYILRCQWVISFPLNSGAFWWAGSATNVSSAHPLDLQFSRCAARAESLEEPGRCAGSGFDFRLARRRFVHRSTMTTVGRVETSDAGTLQYHLAARLLQFLPTLRLGRNVFSSRLKRPKRQL
jgi:hypothetical protein